MKPVVSQLCVLLELSAYLVSELNRRGVSSYLERLEEPDNDDPLKSFIHLECAMPRRIAIRLYRSGPSTGKIELPPYLGPVETSELERQGPDIAARVLADCWY